MAGFGVVSSRAAHAGLNAHLLELLAQSFSVLATLLVGDTPVHVAVTHLDGPDRYRMLQAHAVVDALAGIEGPLLLLGDFNAVPDSEPLRLIEHAGFLRANAGASSTSGNLDVDHIFGHRLVVQSARLPDTGPVSDHQPVIAEVRVR